MVPQYFWRKLLLSLAASPLPARADPVCTMTFLPAGFQAARINNAGRIVGTYDGAAALWSDTGWRLRAAPGRARRCGRTWCPRCPCHARGDCCWWG